MKRTVSLFLVFIFCFTITPFCYAVADNTPFSDDPKAIQVASNSVIMLSCYDKNGELYATGSAFAAFEDGIFVTNYHVIEEGIYSIRAAMESGLEFTIPYVVAYDAEKDLAILRTEAKTGLEPLPIGSSADLERGEKVIAIGSPLGLINTLSIGLYSGTLKDEQTFLQFSAAISHGSSGGALFNDKGEVVGITSASFTEGQNLNLAIPIEDAIELWEERDETSALSVSDFYELWEHIQLYSITYILANGGKFVNNDTIQVEGYVFFDPYDTYTEDSRFVLVEKSSDYIALCDAVNEIEAYGGKMTEEERLNGFMSFYSDKDDVYAKRFGIEKDYEELLKQSALIVFADKGTLSQGDYILVQGGIKKPYLRNIIILDKR